MFFFCSLPSEVPPDEVARLLEVWPEEKARVGGNGRPWAVHDRSLKI